MRTVEANGTHGVHAEDLRGKLVWLVIVCGGNSEDPSPVVAALYRTPSAFACVCSMSLVGGAVI